MEVSRVCLITRLLEEKQEALCQEYHGGGYGMGRFDLVAGRRRPHHCHCFLGKENRYWCRDFLHLYYITNTLYNKPQTKKRNRYHTPLSPLSPHSKNQSPMNIRDQETTHPHPPCPNPSNSPTLSSTPLTARSKSPTLTSTSSTFPLNPSIS